MTGFHDALFTPSVVGQCTLIKANSRGREVEINFSTPFLAAAQRSLQGSHSTYDANSSKRSLFQDMFNNQSLKSSISNIISFSELPYFPIGQKFTIGLIEKNKLKLIDDDDMILFILKANFVSIHVNPTVKDYNVFHEEYAVASFTIPDIDSSFQWVLSPQEAVCVSQEDCIFYFIVRHLPSFIKPKVS